MLLRQFQEAKKLAAENDVASLDAMRRTCSKRQSYVSYVGLVTVLHLFFRDWLIGKFAPRLLSDHPDACRTEYMLVAIIGLSIYFVLSKRYSEKEQLARLALELKERGPSDCLVEE